jgi:hypothetical protein
VNEPEDYTFGEPAPPHKFVACLHPMLLAQQPCGLCGECHQAENAPIHDTSEEELAR